MSAEELSDAFRVKKIMQQPVSLVGDLNELKKSFKFMLNCLENDLQLQGFPNNCQHVQMWSSQQVLLQSKLEDAKGLLDNII